MRYDKGDLLKPQKDKWMAKFRTRLLDLRKERKLSRMDIVRQAEMSYPTVMAWETDYLTRIDADNVHMLMKTLGCTMDELLYTVEEESHEALQPE